MKKFDKYRPLTKKQLKEIVECYAAEFPDWEIVDGDRLVRSLGPVLQQIGFQGLSYQAYRPMGVIRALPYPSVKMLPQFLDIKHDVIDMRAHPRKWRSAIAAMEEQFVPPIRQPLNLREVMRLCEQTAREKTNDLCMLAILNAYLGEKLQAKSSGILQPLLMLAVQLTTKAYPRPTDPGCLPQ
ncbi:hypothetical protein STSP2_01410 [Anaerohalosphaera lusitana]|uniref:Uncharacterized protein n=1 Tax=Anaerohalosphaera lusitana TaxID=1936003 RepID=A0A1U9NKJ4_9BACT|nr:hypothetical protein [Anaerohalosphaera lusitana]AQT68254.1 hypothetical protein STSP2_01410 [Anaerohalosphaera lusitana]